ncbi:glutamyl-tRNA amidotransferase B subunit [Cavenderia fasciculata]|uniref:Glutamyl-tRNA(Gln) amidotransferase subunit B, mitochondrial n=1 Tax=Cavenderia fasciculata TaxID=261658 RepID=F4Q416_CACFS|nr:glutamyl-tRNA amidotransferase B subunit [Cavenderia fasciculata]EGG16930.1 glutamyl-tRNA amidotransferase B subunit [Cavenderia fasciculata]|eukprot:XP_004355404.1 glutamyl-tRNA amidotransferase B subunit [Cavenderia fasciculata]
MSIRYLLSRTPKSCLLNNNNNNNIIGGRNNLFVHNNNNKNNNNNRYSTSTTSTSTIIDENDPSLDYIYSGKGNPYQLVVGVEVHAQIKSKEKLFSNSLNIGSLDGSIANSRVSYVDAAFPGTLPVLNSKCVEQAVKTGLALNASISKYSVFDRKHYFYQDLPQGYQITQYTNPIVKGGEVLLSLKNNRKKLIKLSHIQLEQDSGKSIHDQSPTSTLVDLNRAGVGLMEIVSDCDFRSSEQVGAYLRQLQHLLKSIETSDANMQQGEMRCDINISVRPSHQTDRLGTRVELKNMISIKSIVSAIDAEATRQIEMVESGTPIQRETRGFDLSTMSTFHMRTKEDETDYRFFPDPDLPPLVLSQAFIERVRATIGELPDAMKTRIITQYGLTVDDATILVADPYNVHYFESVLRHNGKTDRSVKTLLPFIIKEMFEWLNLQNESITNTPVSIERMADFIDLVESGYISSRTGKDIIGLMLNGDTRPAKEIIDGLGVSQISDDSVLEDLCVKILEEHHDKIMEYRSGKTRVFKFFVGEIMKQTKGRSNPQKVTSLLQKKIDEFEL